MTLNNWLEKAKKNGIVKEREKKEGKEMEVNVGSSPTQKANQTIKDEHGYEWLVTPRGFKYPISALNKRKPGPYRKFPKRFLRFERFGQEYPCVKAWLETLRARGTKRMYAQALIEFCIAVDRTPEEFGDLHKTIEGQREAKSIATKYILPLVTSKPFKALEAQKALRSFFWAYSGGFPLPLDTKKLKPRSEDKTPFEKPKFYYGTRDEMREHMDRMLLIGSGDLKDKMALTLLFRAGLRSNTLNHFKVKHVQDIIEVEHPETGEKVQLLCLTITGYNKKTDEGICQKTAHYDFPPLIDSPGQPKGYYTFLADDALELFRTFMAEYHRNSKPNGLLFTSKEGGLFQNALRRRFKKNIIRSGAYSERETNKDPNLIRLHDFRWNFGELAGEILSRDRAEMLAGHKLKGVLEHYRKRTKIECAKDYLKINFKLTKESIIKRYREDLERKEARRLEEERRALEKVEEKEPLPPPKTAIPLPQATVESVREHMKPTIERIIKPAPKWCPRGKHFGPNATDEYCHDVCAKQAPTEFQACQELQLEKPEAFI